LKADFTRERRFIRAWGMEHGAWRTEQKVWRTEAWLLQNSLKLKQFNRAELNLHTRKTDSYLISSPQ